MFMEKNKIKKVLIAVDYDETSIKVAEQGFSMAQAMNAETTLLHVISEQPAYYSSYNLMLEWRVDMLGDLEKAVYTFMEKAKKSLGDDNIQIVVKFGDISDTILKTAKDLDADIIVIGSHSREWLEKIFLGSQAQDILKNTTLPLFIIPTKKQD
jgi:nucleotide-binding universal stress UspA family protein